MFGDTMTSLLKKESTTDGVDDNGEKRSPLVKARNLGVYYEINKGKRDDFRSYVHGLFKKREPSEKHWALKKVNFNAYPGDVFGIIGSNGAGKTTLCRVIAGLLRPNRGSIKIRGDVSALFSLGAGFNNELSGRENIVLNGMMLGMERKRVNELVPYIHEFSGLGSFLDQPIKRYSSGMRARLGFSIAASIESEILVIDEVLGTGDIEFKERAANKMKELVSGAKLVMVVTHETDFVENNCNKAIWIDNGRLRASGEPSDVVAQYIENSEGNSQSVKKRKMKLRATETTIGQQKVIQVDNLGVKFHMGKEPFWALKDISFTVNEGEILGIIGSNGAGKTTLCRVLSGIFKEDHGNVNLKGAITALLSFGTGFNNQLSGIDNIYLNGMMLGIPKTAIYSLEGEIIEFADIGKHIYKPVKQYSSGMKSRLGFSIAASLQPDIFIVDEALSTGDVAFREKATAKMQDMLEQAKAVLLVTHSLAIVEKVCTRVLWLEQGRIKFDGDSKKAVKLYKEFAKNKQAKKLF